MFKSIIVSLALVFAFSSCSLFRKSNKKEISAYQKPEWAAKKFSYKPSRTLLNDLLHTKLEVSFDWKSRTMDGKATLTFKPYFYNQNTLELDAKGFDIREVSLVDKSGAKSALKYTYDSLKLNIDLNKTYRATDTFKVFIDYTAKPEKLKTSAGEAITSDKGLFFIIPDSTDPKKPYQIWTQGETEASACWFPTIDSPNEKSTQEMAITVDNKYKTLSNGEFVKSVLNKDGSRTDFWNQKDPHSIYLFMMAIGEFSIIKDKWKNKEVSYYVEPKYEPYARKIFGQTPEMMTFFSDKLNYPFPWAKYSSIVVREYVSGAMENTSATVFYDAVQKTDRELLDGNDENIIAHELFHHWFGDLVTCESWANLPLNESFANYSEYLWEEYKRGNYAAEYSRFNEANNYLRESNMKQEPLIRYCYDKPDDMFDSHSYSKGGTILHLLRKTVGDTAFYTALNTYLKDNAYKTTEIHHLRHAFEKVTGQDLMWFFDQWFMKAGHPEIQVQTKYENNKINVQVAQLQDTLYTPIYRIPTKIAYWINDKKIEKAVELNSKTQIFEIESSQKPSLVLIDEERLIPGNLTQEKSLSEYVYQYNHSLTFASQMEALDNIGSKIDSAGASKMILSALEHDFWLVRSTAISLAKKVKNADTVLINALIERMAEKDKNTEVRSSALAYLSDGKVTNYKSIFQNAINDSSYAVQGNALLALLKLKEINKDSLIAVFATESNGTIVEAVSEFYSKYGDSTKIEWFKERLKEVKPESLFFVLQNFGDYLIKSKKSVQQKGIAILLPIAEKHQYDWIRYSAFKSLSILDDNDKVLHEKLIAINNKEKSERLKRAYKNLL